jgi:tetratricopeptide (TPR) repeat protein
MEVTPEQCFERAMKLVERGKLDKAIKLLQIATLRAPDEGRYREALQEARRLKESVAAEPPPAEPVPAAEGPEIADTTDPPTEASDTPTSSIAEASAEDLYKRAMALKEEGHTDRAARMMQIAAAKAPSEARYREALEAIRRPGSQNAEDERISRALQMSSFDEVERILRDSLRTNRDQPEKLQLLALLLLRVREDPRGALGPIRESVRLAPNRLSTLLLQEEVLRALGDRSEAARAAQAIRELTTDEERLEKARQRLNEKIPSRAVEAAPTIALPRSSRQPAILGAVAAALLLALGGIWYLNQPASVDIAPYKSLLPVVSAIAPIQSELIVRVKEPDWRALEPTERESRLRGVMAEASGHGFRAVYVHSEQDVLLGSVQGGVTFLPK